MYKDKITEKLEQLQWLLHTQTDRQHLRGR